MYYFHDFNYVKKMVSPIYPHLHRSIKIQSCMARGEMVRYMAEKEIENPADVQTFDRLGYNFRRDLSSEMGYVFERKIMK